MSRWLKALPLALAMMALSTFAGSCGSNGPAQVRFVHVIPDAPAMDVNINGTAEFLNISFRGVQPNQPGYTSVPSGGDTIEGFLTGTTTPVFTSTASLGASAHYTLVATGLSKGSSIVLLQTSDNIPTPPPGDVGFRVINASPSGPPCASLNPPTCPNSVDVYIELNPNSGPGLPLTIQSLAYTQASNYVFFAFNPNNETIPPGYTVYVTASGTLTPIISEGIYPANAGAVRTLVLTDAPGGGSMNKTFLELSDLN